MHIDTAPLNRRNNKLRSFVHQSDNLLFGAMQAFYGASFGVLFVFIIGYMERYGYSGTEIGYVRAVGAAMGIGGLFFWSTIADRRQRIGTVIASVVIVGIVLAPLLMIGGGKFWHVMIFFALASFFLIPVQVLIDSWTTIVARYNAKVSYGLTRAMASLGFALALLFAGRMFDAIGIEYIFLTYALLLLPLLLCVLITGTRHSSAARTNAGAEVIPRSAAANDNKERGRKNSDSSPRSRTLNRPLISFLGICSIMMACFIASYNFMPLLMTALGGSHRHVGAASAVMAMSEIPFMICSAMLLKRFRDSRVIGVACLFFGLRVSSHLLFQTPTQLIIGYGLQGMSFGLFVPASVSLCARLARPSHRTRVLALLDIIVFGVGDIISSVAGGWLIDLYGVRGMYVVISVVVWVPVVWYYWRFMRRTKLIYI